MITIRKSNDRGHANQGWLDSYHTFSFANYHDNKWMGFRDLRVINQDKIAQGKGFGTHGHENMEIVTYVYEGALEHKDSMGTGSVLRPGDVQRMSAGTGVTHSEFNHSKTEELQLLQIWIFPEKKGIKPEYEEKRFEPETKKNRLRLVVSQGGKGGSVAINQNASIYATLLDEGKTVSHSLRPSRGAWVQVVKGLLELNEKILGPGDGAAIEDEKELNFTAKKNSEFLLFDLP
jgi:redox-sensitive bicupin YhaK (pirin superfamily)